MILLTYSEKDILSSSPEVNLPSRLNRKARSTFSKLTDGEKQTLSDLMDKLLQ